MPNTGPNGVDMGDPDQPASAVTGSGTGTGGAAMGPTLSTSYDARWNYKLSESVLRLPDHVLFSIGQRLSVISPEKDYRKLAGLLNYTGADMSRFVGNNPCYGMLTDWGTNALSTIHVLRSMLIQMGRDDVRGMLDKELEDPCLLIVVLKYPGIDRPLDNIEVCGNTLLAEALRESLSQHNLTPDDVRLCGSTTSIIYSRQTAADFKGKQINLEVIKDQHSVCVRLIFTTAIDIVRGMFNKRVGIKPVIQARPKKTQSFPEAELLRPIVSTTRAIHPPTSNPLPMNHKREGATSTILQEWPTNDERQPQSGTETFREENEYSTLTYPDLPTSEMSDLNLRSDPPYDPTMCAAEYMDPVQALVSPNGEADACNPDVTQRKCLNWPPPPAPAPRPAQKDPSGIEDEYLTFSDGSTEPEFRNTQPVQTEAEPGEPRHDIGLDKFQGYHDVHGHREVEAKLHLKKDHTYLFRDSTQSPMAASVVYKGSVRHYRLHCERADSRREYFFTPAYRKETVPALIKFHSKTSLEPDKNGRGPKLQHPLPPDKKKKP